MRIARDREKTLGDPEVATGTDYEGKSVYRHGRNRFTVQRSPVCWCEFEDESGNAIHIDEIGRVMAVTWRRHAV